MRRAHRIEPHHPEDPYGEGKVDHQDDDEEQHEQVEATLPPAVDADLVDEVGRRPGRAAALGGCDILLPNHLLDEGETCRQISRREKQMLFTQIEHGVHENVEKLTRQKTGSLQ